MLAGGTGTGIEPAPVRSVIASGGVWSTYGGRTATFEKSDQFGTSSAVRRTKYQVTCGSSPRTRTESVTPGELGAGRFGTVAAPLHHPVVSVPAMGWLL